jgi:hypothetical protein
MTIVAARSVSGFFGEVVEDSIRQRRVDATDGATAYLVALLADFARPDQRAGETLERSLTLLFDEAINTPNPAERFERLRCLGDGVLYGCGFFGDHFEARGVDPKYLHGLGTRAYDAASHILQARAPVENRGPYPSGGFAPLRGDLFAELAHKFEAFVAIVADVADATIAMGTETSRGVLKVYERWLKTGSNRLATALTSRGVVPTRGPRGIVQ